MIKHVWTVVCQNVIIDRNTNNLSLQNIFEQIDIQGEPTPKAKVPIKFDVVSLWTRTNPDIPSRGQMRLSLLSPSGEKIGGREGEINLVDTERYRIVTHFPGLPAEEAGRHIFKIELQQEAMSEWNQVASVPLTVNFSPPEIEEEEEIEV